MKLYHTSPGKIEKITEDGTFSDCLCFASSPYLGDYTKDHLYTIEIDESDIIRASQLFYQEDYKLMDEIVDRVKEYFEVDEETAQDLIDGSLSAFDLKKSNESGFCKYDLKEIEADHWLQGLKGKAAEALGYRAAEARDEQGAVYLVPLLNKESEMNYEGLLCDYDE